jgi:hypothetical protein
MLGVLAAMSIALPIPVLAAGSVVPGYDKQRPESE